MRPFPVYRHAALFGALLAAGAIAGAADSASGAPLAALERPYIGLSGGYAWADDKRGVQDGIGLKLSFGWALSERWSAQLQSSHFNFETNVPGATDFYRTSLGLDAVYAFNPDGWSPLLLLGIGAAQNDVTPDRDDDIGFTANGGLGLMTPVLNAFGVRLRAEARYVYDRFQDHPGDVHAYLGLTFPLRRPRTVEVVRTEIKEIVTERIVREEAPRDSDSDGVPDGIDRCPDTLRGARVDRDGCIVEQAVIILQGVHFEHDSAQLSPSSTTILSQAADSLRGQASMRVEVAGHTDSSGSDDYNQRLSRHRAQSVVDYLVSLGIDRTRLSPVGYGESTPVADNGAAAGRASNRRVEFRVLAR